MGRPKFVTAAEAVKLVQSGDTVGSSGFIGMGHAEEITYELEKRFLQTGEPRDLTVTWGSSQSDTKSMVGCNRLRHQLWAGVHGFRAGRPAGTATGGLGAEKPGRKTIVWLFSYWAVWLF